MKISIPPLAKQQARKFFMPQMKHRRTPTNSDIYRGGKPACFASGNGETSMAPCFAIPGCEN